VSDYERLRRLGFCANSSTIEVEDIDPQIGQYFMKVCTDTSKSFLWMNDSDIKSLIKMLQDCLPKKGKKK